MNRAALTAALLLAALFNLQFLLVDGAPSLMIDFEVFRRAAVEPLSVVYRAQAMPFGYPPTALLFFAPLALLPLKAGYVTWTLLSVAAFGAGVCRLCGRFVATLSFASAAAIHGLVLGQVPMLLSGLIFLAFSLPPVACGALLAVVAGVKPQLLLFAPLALLARRDWRVLASMAVTGAALLLISLILFGVRPWLDWVAAMPSFMKAVIDGNALHLVISPAGQALYSGLPVAPVLLGAIALGLTAVWSGARRVDGASLVALIVAASLISSPYSHVHDSIALIPACIQLMRSASAPWALAALLVFAGPPLATMLGIVVLLGLTIARFGPGSASSPGAGASASAA